ncbi:thioredoxin [Thermoanaerobacter thermohydrosulfuricus]|jgi:thioredoxin 1|uniref:Thioredoxin n=4 Tax=Thermoanaerobacter TaxID=1754 RepID=I9KWL1_9THEO|nr:thioredoxin [Thermoanaerobacter wiegelii Rt8.B1]EGD52220.1 thioredoxin [Thermoanaerobacter ethanolicus JW 200]EIW01311.1 thioredoxin [Thermoanaerobacter siderophilus SR4]EMT40379.1 thioredoxin [Thermoanaerobacter thermohydrosulfuricus WC1]SDE97177.1 thioredoxin [Thermoanaerobacter thermohydrosulfuricus]HHY81050.1 thioredoxin [Thermoanaerobacter sp.]
MAELVITLENFEQEVVNSDVPVLIDFWAEWCMPCRMVAPIIDELAKEYEGKIKVGKINVDEENELAMKFRIMSIPTIGLFKNGKMVDKIIGARPKADFVKFIEKHLNGGATQSEESDEVEITYDNFEEEVVNSDVPVLIDFWAEWCAPCRLVAPIIDELAKEYKGKIKVGKVNVDEENELAMQFRIMSIPTIGLFKNGKMVDKIIGARPKADFVKFIEKHLNN